MLKLGLVALLASSARDYFEKGKMQLQGNLAKVRGTNSSGPLNLEMKAEFDQRL